METIDCRGLACPAPVLRSKETIEKKDIHELTVDVDNEAARQNVTRFLESQGFRVTSQENRGEFRVTGRRGDKIKSEKRIVERPSTDQKRIMVMVSSDSIGHGDDELGSKLMMSFLKTLKEMGEELWRLVFVNNGVKLTIKDSEHLPVLKELEGEGLHILVCGTCLTHFGLLDKKRVGDTTNMLDIVTAMQLADKVINI
ncbi:MAG: sulfurtransferase-like selenium metabolism protein YedF [Desulfatiglans sp.]|jgi:selenium metabolism protein YedF|nr:sulfurtransferase-like selenium metabolism protein YedF [Thermodesulfobacteriota bacterium]MEE4352789.1 sulfurtransferase-like selenium metabolism protein YedF [Desulfatiglans sp.]